MSGIKDIESELKKSGVVLLSVGSKNYRSAVGSLLGLTKSFRKTCYVTLNDPYDTIRPKAAPSTVYIDCVTSTIKSPKTAEGVIYVSSPRALTEISIAITKAISGFKMDSLIFDSISALLVYEKSVNALKFIHSAILVLRSADVKTVFVVLKEDVSEELMKDLSMFVDKVLEI